MRPQIVAILTIVLSLLNSTVMHAQATSPPPPPPTPPPELPLDSGIILLIIAGLIYGCYKVSKNIRLAKTRS
ncbi:MAG: hypothetical protein KJO05_07885 [Bacteroidia bacterium]|nr:hypothetical protein [Bacteroidia bacterium]NNF31461.1 hypothetical protein [Flavobacteriaceae bacterium]MBT8275536.1 hypothetical protein [Bacteroidia bacterium]NNJ82064.1 hypothetical protein [Flavobacteriaceae bacterium]NNK54040.1 hypothetical protein [Flavobacteriaceae bacterium]